MRNVLLSAATALFALVALVVVASSPEPGSDGYAPPLRPGVTDLGFERLADFDYGDVLPRTTGHIPSRVRELDGQRVRIVGHVFPMATREGDPEMVFALSRTSPDCCFGRMPAINEWVLVRAPRNAKLPDDPRIKAWVTGTLDVGETRDAEGVVLSIYALDAEAVE